MRILLLSDSGINADKGGFPQTLYNIFSCIKPGDILFITSLQSWKIAASSPPFTECTITYDLEILPYQENRLGNYINKFINWFNYSFNQRFNRFKKLQAVIKKFDPDIVITAPNNAEGVFMHYQLQPAFKGKKVFPYFMDDWLYQSGLKWAGGSIHALVKKLLNENDSWLMISERLSNILSERYNAMPSRVLEIHNPVDLSTWTEPPAIKQKETYRFAYAGALWPMHFDALLVLVKAINILKRKRKINLVIYTAQSNWNWRKAELEPLQVDYGGHIPYKDIHQKLAEADCLLITSSFSGEWETHTRGSVQTKITDYLKAGRLIISCGPSYSANNDFLKKHDCGICIETNKEEAIAGELDKILNEIETNQKYVLQGFEVLKTEFSFEKVHRKLKDFLAA